MKSLIILLFCFSSVVPSKWLTDMNQAREQASQSHKLILLTFSGSDWCVPCIRLHREIFESDVFEKYAEDNLVLVNADFPRLRKNKLSKEQTAKNDQLAQTYNPKGNFPLTILMNANGTILKEWEGFPNETADKFVSELDASLHTVAINN